MPADSLSEETEVSSVEADNSSINARLPAPSVVLFCVISSGEWEKLSR